MQSLFLSVPNSVWFMEPKGVRCDRFMGQRNGMCFVHGTVRDKNEMDRLHFCVFWDKEYTDRVARAKNEMGRLHF